jgi:type IV secretion system protein VirD4
MTTLKRMAESQFESDLLADVPRGMTGASGSLVEAKWADRSELEEPAWGYRNEQGDIAGILWGYRDGRAVGVRDDRHATLIAGSRNGKGVSVIVPNLLTYAGSVLAIDPKGELTRITTRARRAKGQHVFGLDPFGANGVYPSACFNPLLEIDMSSPYAIDDIASVAEAMIISNERDPHWGDSGRSFVEGNIGLIMSWPEDQRHLPNLRRLVMLTHPAVIAKAAEAKCGREEALFKLMMECTALDGLVAGIGHAFASMADKERASVMSTVRTQTKYLDSPALAKIMKTSDFRLRDLKTKKLTVFLSLPATRMATHARWLRVIIALALVAFEREQSKPDLPALWILDEFASLGHMRSLEMAAGLMAGFGVKLLTVLQDLGQIKKAYKDSWETFIANSGVVAVWGVNDQTTLEYVSQKLGQTGVRIQQPSGATSGSRLAGASPFRDELRVQRLLAAHEIDALMARERRRVIVMAAGRRPIILQRMIYHEDAPFAGLFDA